MLSRLTQHLLREEAKRHKLQEEYIDSVTQRKEKQKVEQQLAQCRAHFKRCDADLRRIDALGGSMSEARVYSAKMLGDGIITEVPQRTRKTATMS